MRFSYIDRFEKWVIKHGAAMSFEIRRNEKWDRVLKDPVASVGIVVSGSLAGFVVLMIYHKKYIWAAVSWICANAFIVLTLIELAKT